MKIFKIILFTSLLFFSNIVFWLESPQNIVLDKALDNSLEISWEKVKWAWVYAISYWTKTASGWVYEHDLDVIVNEEAKWKIENLEANTKYFIGIKAYDSNDNESEYSSEVSFSTLKKMEWLKIEDSKIIDTRNVELKFNLDLKSDSIVNLNIVNIKNDLENIELEKYEIKNKVLKIFLDKELKLENKYSITILTLQWLNWETIKAWIDWIKEFFVDKNTKKYTKEEEIDLNSAWSLEEEVKKEVKINKILWWKDIVNKEEVTEKVAKEKKDLPVTWPTETLLFLILSLVAWSLFVTLRRKTNA